MGERESKKAPKFMDTPQLFVSDDSGEFEDEKNSTPVNLLSKANLELLEETTKPLLGAAIETESYRELTVDEFFSNISDSDEDDKKSVSSALTSSSKISTASKRLKVYHCQFDGCGKSYSRPSQLLEHQQVSHQGLRKFKCPKCDSSYTKKYHLERHLYTHGLEKPFKCSHCEKRFITRQQLARHEKTHVQSFQCEQCSERFYKHGQLRTHISKVHTVKLLKCEICETEFTKPDRLRTHMKTQHNTNQDTSSTLLEEQMRINQYQCDILSCTQSFTTWTALQQHKKNDHPKLKCGICAKLCVGESGLQMHMMIHDTSMIIKHWKCVVCDEEFAKKMELATHCKDAHNMDILDDPVKNTDFVKQDDAVQTSVPVKSKMSEVDYLKAEKSFQEKIKSNDSMKKLLLNTIGKKYTCTFTGCYRKFKTRERFETHVQKHKDYEAKLLELSKDIKN